MQIQISDTLNGIIKYAREEAMRTGSYGIGPDHLFLGIIRHEENSAFQVLQGLGVEPAELKSFIDSRIFTNETIPYSEIRPYKLFPSGAERAEHHRHGGHPAEEPGGRSAPPASRPCRTTDSYGQAFLRSRGVDYGRMLSFMESEGLLHVQRQEQQPAQGNEEEEEGQAGGKKKELDIEEFGYDLTKAAREGKLDPVVGRDMEIARVIEILGRRKKNNPMLIGEPGVGKSAIVEGIALRIASGDISPPSPRNASFRWTSLRWWPAPNTGATSRSASRPSSRKHRPIRT
jgi:ATPases with chaperone activity, ATP-binding subunit